MIVNFLLINLLVISYIDLVCSKILKDLLLNLLWLSKDQTPGYRDSYSEIMTKHFFSNKVIIPCFFWGIVTTIFGFIFGLGPGWIHQITLSLQHFSIGFLAGYAIAGINTIWKLIDLFSYKESFRNIKLDYFYPDKCAGTLIIGNTLFKFSVFGLIISIVLFFYLSKYPWSNTKEIPLIGELIIFWKLFPVILSGLLYFIPVMKLNKILRKYKLSQQLRIKKREQYIADKILMFEFGSDFERNLKIINDYRESIKYTQNYIEEMNTWPYNLKYRTVFISIFVPALTGTFSTVFIDDVSKWLEKVLQ